MDPTPTAISPPGNLEGSPWLTVVMPVFNGEEFLPRALQSLARAGVTSSSGVEVVAVDDGSTDRSPSILQELSTQLPIHLVQGRKRAGWIEATNVGIRAARGTHCCFLHQDDLWLPDRLSLVSRAISLHPKLDLLLTAARFVDADDRVLGAWRCPLPETSALDPAMLRSRLLVQNFLAICAPVIRTRSLRQTGCLDSSLWYTADWDLWLKLAERAKSIRCDPRPTVAFRIHGQSQTVQRSRRSDEFRNQLETVLDRHLDKPCEPYVLRAARFSIEVNVALASGSHGGSPPILRLLASAIGLGPRAGYLYLRWSRLLERLVPRLRLRLRNRL